jgi:pimeloyl-ACP methyl ester carboxylesterase
MNPTALASSSSSRHLTRYAVAAIGLLAVAVLFVSSSSAGGTTGHATKPTIVLVHGAWADSGSWNEVVQRLQDDGYTVDVPPNPLRGLQNDSETIASFLSTVTGPVVLVGHSYGGEVITNAAVGNVQVKALVYVDAFIPDEGQTVLSLTVAGSCFAVADLNTVINFVPFPGAPAGVTDAYVKQDVFPNCFANGLSKSDAAVLAATQRPLATSAFGDASGVPAWKTIPSWAVIGTADHAIPPAGQLAMAEHAGAHITQIDAPHLSMIAKPADVTEVIEQAANATD